MFVKLQTYTIVKSVLWLLMNRTHIDYFSCWSIHVHCTCTYFMFVMNEILLKLTLTVHLQITLGRATKDNQIDVDLSLEGPAWKISRRQGIIKLRSNGDFFLANEGKRPFYVDGKAILAGNKQKLNNNSVVEVYLVPDYLCGWGTTISWLLVKM